MALLLTLAFLICVSFAGNPDGAMLTRFRNIANYDMVLWWITPYKDEDIRFFGHLTRNGGMTSFTSYVGHEFFWARPGREHEEGQRRQFFKIVPNKILYVYSDENDPGSDHVVEQTHDELQFLHDYYQTDRRHWLSSYQRPPPVVPFIDLMQNEDNAMKTNYKWVESDSYFWTCLPSSPQKKNTASSASRFKRFFSGDSSASASSTHPCQKNNGGEPLRFLVEELYPEDPRIYKISNFITEFEAQHIINLSQNSMQRSTVGDGRNRRQDPTRTCSNTWLSMNHSRVVETIYHRIGDVLGIDKYQMDVESTVDTNDGVASHMEVINFKRNEHYSRHYDNAVNNEIYLHIISVQVILRTSDDFAGGATSFPHAGSIHSNNKDAHRNQAGFDVDNEQYSALIWYNMLPDGNLDETSMYSNLRVHNGEQWMFHVNIWDPTLPVHGDPKMPHNVIYGMHDEL